MPVQTPTVGTGAVVTITDAETTSWTGEVTSATPEITQEAIDVSHLGSVQYREYITGDLADGTVQIEGHFSGADVPPLYAAVDWEITFPGTTAGSFTGKGVLTSWSTPFTTEELASFSMTLQITAFASVPSWDPPTP